MAAKVSRNHTISFIQTHLNFDHTKTIYEFVYYGPRNTTGMFLLTYHKPKS